MRKRTQFIIAGVSCLLGLLMASAVVFYFWALLPLRRFSSPEWWQSASQAERAALCHVLIDRHLDRHDVWLYLRHVGNKESVPRLLAQFEQAGAILADGGWCVADHCLDALRSITGHDAGKTPGAWRTWWEETGSHLPEGYFYPRAANSEPHASIRGCPDSSMRSIVRQETRI